VPNFINPIFSQSTHAQPISYYLLYYNAQFVHSLPITPIDIPLFSTIINLRGGVTMAFPDSVKDQAFARSGGRCECTRQHSSVWEAPHQERRCPRTFTRYGGNWEAHHIAVGGPDTLSNCEALCLTCHSLTFSYGR